MQFKVGDRVEVIKPAIGLIDEDKNNLGLGTVTSVVGQEVEVKVDTNDYPWWYHLDKVRPLIPVGAITTIKEDPPTTVADLTTPSITVGTQVRLTGVVMSSGKDGEVVTIESDGFVFGVPVGALEVIRQPFKRGEVVYFEDHDITCVVLEDEQNGRMLLIEAGEGKYATYVDAAKYERRP